MCGIFGYFDQKKSPLTHIDLQKMATAIHYRGPDGQGFFEAPGVGLGNCRLAILDIENGTQPFIAEDKSVVVVQNGEIFNHIELAESLRGTAFECQTNCDTEVLLRLYQKEGIDFISKLNGMFAIAIYDANEDHLFLIRDRVGEKPLYYFYDTNLLIFGSEIKTILSTGIKKEVDYNAINSFLTLNYVAPPLTMFKNIQHVMPGTYLKISKNSLESKIWWDLSKISTLEKSESEWISIFNETLQDAVRIRLRSDVPFGAFLSGGVDSSTVVGLMSQILDTPVKTFSIGFDDPKYDESEFAQAAATKFKTDHTMEKAESNLFHLWELATYHCDQPHGDTSFLPTYRVAQLAAAHVKMVLTGDGADELFAGYDKYKNFFLEIDPSSNDKTFQELYISNISLFGEQTKKQLFSEKLLETQDATNFLKTAFDAVRHMDRINQALFIDTMFLLSGNNLVKPDRMGMAVSIENRAPFLDYRMIELAFSMPGNLKLRQTETKYLYKKAVESLIGHDLAYRKKQMFTVPVGEWLKKELKNKAQDLLLSEKTRSRNLFNYTFIEDMFEQHCNETKNYTRELRALMALEIWFRVFID